MPPSIRPQTLKQAKRAYRKSGATARLSASELAQAERRVALQERADRIKEREARRKANLKKREDKIAKEREEARKMGTPFTHDSKPGRKVGASQLRLGGFLGGVKKINHDQEKVEDVQTEDRGGMFEETKHQERDDTKGSRRSMEPAPTLPPVEPVIDSLLHPLPNTRPLASSGDQMPPPPKPSSKPAEVPNEAYDEYFPSNTQIQRELLPERPENTPMPPPIMTRKPIMSSIKFTSCCINTDTTGLLAGISTQDLDYDDEPNGAINAKEKAEDQGLVALAQISTQDLIFSQGLADIWDDAKDSEPDFVDEPTDNDLEGLAMEIEMNESTNMMVK